MEETSYSLVSQSKKTELLEEWYRDKGLSGASLKLLACFFMLIDHISQSGMLYQVWGIGGGSVIGFWNEPMGTMIASIMVLFGRIAFPIYCFFLVHGMFLTKDYRKYISRLFLFGIVSELPFDYALSNGFSWYHQNVFFTLAFGALLILLLEKIREHIPNIYIRLIVSLVVAYVIMYVAEFTYVDYGSFGIIAILFFYVAYLSRIKTTLMGLLGFFFEASLYGFVYLSLPLIYFYNGKRGNMNKYFYYAFYPAHLALIYLIRDFVIPQFIGI